MTRTSKTRKQQKFQKKKEQKKTFIFSPDWKMIWRKQKQRKQNQ